MAVTYRGTINVDHTSGKGHSHHAERLKNALVQAGWKWVETSAYVIETVNLAEVWRGIDLVARQSSSIGQLSALTFHIQSSTNFSGSAPNTSAHHTQAMSNIMSKPFPAP